MNSLVNKTKKLFFDTIRLTVQGGKGGHGLPQYGGIGGKGGDVYVKGSTKVKKLGSVLKKAPDFFIKAPDGSSSRRTRLLGESGRDLVIDVPIGVTVEDSNKQVLGDINSFQDKIMIAMGGRGGDKFNDNQGFVGQKKVITLNFKMISDAVLVGFPNAGKSTLLSVLSAANPKIAAYPFTTIRPNLGTIKYPDFRQITVADLPGLVEGAHKNLGLGHEFLKHICRTKLLVFLIDINNIDLGPMYKQRSPLETIFILNKEIELYDDTLLQKPAILAVSKMDTLIDSRDRYKKLKSELLALYDPEKRDETLSKIDESIRPNNLVKFEEIIPISSKKKKNINELKELLRDIIDEEAENIRLLDHNNQYPKSYKELESIENNRIAQQ